MACSPNEDKLAPIQPFGLILEIADAVAGEVEAIYFFIYETNI